MAGLAPQSHYWLYLGILAVVSYGNLNLLMIGKRKFTPWDAFTIFDLKNSVWQYEEQTKRNPPLLRQLILKGSGVFFGRKDGNDVGKGQNIDGHVIVFGGSGSGKSSCIAIPTLNRYQGGVLAIDIKDGGELQRKSSTNAPVCVLRPGLPVAMVMTSMVSGQKKPGCGNPGNSGLIDSHESEESPEISGHWANKGI